MVSTVCLSIFLWLLLQTDALHQAAASQHSLAHFQNVRCIRVRYRGNRTIKFTFIYTWNAQSVMISEISAFDLYFHSEHLPLRVKSITFGKFITENLYQPSSICLRILSISGKYSTESEDHALLITVFPHLASFFSYNIYRRTWVSDLVFVFKTHMSEHVRLHSVWTFYKNDYSTEQVNFRIKKGGNNKRPNSLTSSAAALTLEHLGQSTGIHIRYPQ